MYSLAISSPHSDRTCKAVDRTVGLGSCVHLAAAAARRRRKETFPRLRCLRASPPSNASSHSNFLPFSGTGGPLPAAAPWQSWLLSLLLFLAGSSSPSPFPSPSPSPCPSSCFSSSSRSVRGRELEVEGVREPSSSAKRPSKRLFLTPASGWTIRAMVATSARTSCASAASLIPSTAQARTIASSSLRKSIKPSMGVGDSGIINLGTNVFLEVGCLCGASSALGGVRGI
mmetsp:Transcript_20632/g.44027  ORF Transcript_20632/g.44027 Transcript_20632/m.44027 type:complete len:229 (+) Transcript_20632:350-1036(+)